MQTKLAAMLKQVLLIVQINEGSKGAEKDIPHWCLNPKPLPHPQNTKAPKNLEKSPPSIKKQMEKCQDIMKEHRMSDWPLLPNTNLHFRIPGITIKEKTSIWDRLSHVNVDKWFTSTNKKNTRKWVLEEEDEQ